MKIRQARLFIEYDGRDITADISLSVLNFSFTDNSSGKADEIQIKLEDKASLWRGSWYPEKGAKIKSSIIVENWNAQGHTESLPCGSFEIDDIQLSGPPDIADIKAVSVPVSSSLRGEKKTKAWEVTTLSKIASEISSKAGLKLLFESGEDTSYDRVDQCMQNDLEFLYKLCRDSGLALKVTDNQIVIFDEGKYESKDSVRKIVRGATDILSYSFETSSRDVYNSSEVSYQDTETGEKINAEYKPSNSPKVGQKLKVNEKSNFAKGKKEPKEVKKAQAVKKAKSNLREKNKNEFKAKIKLVGDVRLCAGCTIDIEGFGIFDGKYYIETAVHNVDSCGYIIDLDIRKTLEGY